MLVTPQARARTVFTVLLCMLGLLLARAGYIQLVQGEEYSARAQRMHFTEVSVPAPRGRILDRHGRTLVASYHSCSIAIDPQRVEVSARTALRIASLIDEPGAAASFAKIIETARAKGRRFAYLRRRCDRHHAARVRAAGIAGIDIREEPRREYPHGSMAAALLGVVGTDKHGRIAGLSGLESEHDAKLRGVDGTRSIFRSGRRRHLHLFPDTRVAPRSGSDLHVTIDSRIQQAAEEALDELWQKHSPKSATAIVMDPRTGDILAMAGRPVLDPYAFPAVDKESLRIPATQFVYEPGSTMKPLVVAAAMSAGAVRPGQVFDCGPGVKYFGRRPVRDVRPNHDLDLEGVLVKSSNTGMAQIGQLLGLDPMYRFMRRAGFQSRTGLGLAGEEIGKMTPREKWRENWTLVSVSFGREIMVTPLQLMRAYTGLLNDGAIVHPRLLANDPVRVDGHLDLDPATARFVRRAMQRVVEEGTGRRARIRDIAVGGKTGTTERFPKGSRRYVSSFIGFAPVDDPQLLVLVVADEPQSHKKGIRPYGGVVAAPAVRAILTRSLPLCSPSSESGVRHRNNKTRKVRVAAVHRSSVWAEEEDSSARSRNPGSVDEGEDCRFAAR